MDLNDPNLNAAVLQRRQAARTIDSSQPAALSTPTTTDTLEHDAKIRSMIASTGQLDLDDRGNWDFHGGSSGTVFVRQMREQLGGLLGSEDRGSFLPRVARPARAENLFDSPRSATESSFDTTFPGNVDLPSKEVARDLCSNTLNGACCLLRFVHQPTFYEMFDKIYDTPFEEFGNEENRFLPLLYLVLALGYMYEDEPDQSNHDLRQLNYKACIEQG